MCCQPEVQSITGLYATDTLLNNGGGIVTVGIDNTTKAAGHKVYNVKADHITVAGPDRKRY